MKKLLLFILTILLFIIVNIYISILLIDQTVLKPSFYQDIINDENVVSEIKETINQELQTSLELNNEEIVKLEAAIDNTITKSYLNENVMIIVNDLIDHVKGDKETFSISINTKELKENISTELDVEFEEVDKNIDNELTIVEKEVLINAKTANIINNVTQYYIYATALLIILIGALFVVLDKVKSGLLKFSSTFLVTLIPSLLFIVIARLSVDRFISMLPGELNNEIARNIFLSLLNNFATLIALNIIIPLILVIVIKIMNREKKDEFTSTNDFDSILKI